MIISRQIAQISNCVKILIFHNFNTIRYLCIPHYNSVSMCEYRPCVIFIIYRNPKN